MRAWVYVDPELVLARAPRARPGGVFTSWSAARDRDRRQGHLRHARHHADGVRITDPRTAPPNGRRIERRIARRHGMLPLGKLVTTEFAAWPPGPTVNPHTSQDPGRVLVRAPLRRSQQGWCPSRSPRRRRARSSGRSVFLRRRELQANYGTFLHVGCQGDLGIVRHRGRHRPYRRRRRSRRGRLGPGLVRVGLGDAARARSRPRLRAPAPRPPRARARQPLRARARQPARAPAPRLRRGRPARARRCRTGCRRCRGRGSPVAGSAAAAPQPRAQGRLAGSGSQPGRALGLRCGRRAPSPRVEP